MKGIVLAGGNGTRMLPLTEVTNKHMLPVNDRPMIFHPIEKLVEAGITEIMVVLGGNSVGDIVRLVGSGNRFGAKITYRCQDQPDGIAGALLLCEQFVGNDRSITILGDNIFQASLAPFVQQFEEQQQGAKILIKSVPDPERFGVVETKGNKVTRVIEKPKTAKSNDIAIGVYMYDSSVFEIIRTLQKSERGEYEISDVQNCYIERDALTYSRIKGWWTDAGLISTLHRASLYSMHNTEHV